MTARHDASMDSGFTLVELLLVITILGILAGIVAFSVGGVTDRGQNSACATDKQTLQSAQEAYFVSNRVYATQTTLVGAGLIHGASTLFDTDSSGTVFAQPGSGC